jgi:hypothetical protein
MAENDKDWLPSISILTPAPIFVEQAGAIVVLKKGYHETDGGVYVTKEWPIRELGLTYAKAKLLELLADFNFTTPADQSRALASLLAPAFKLGRLLTEDAPLDMAEADQSQAGKTYRLKLICALYGDTPHLITVKGERAVGSLDESISQGLVDGHAFIMFDNVRGVLNSQLLESAVRGTGAVNARVSYSREREVSAERVVWLLSSNAAQATPDLANRSVITRILKHKPGYQFKRYAEGDLLAHIKANQADYLSAVYTVLCEWHRQGKPRTDEARHDFREWTQTMDWLVQHLFGLPPLMDGHREEQERISNPDLDWLRKVALVIDKADKLGDWFQAGELIDLCEGNGIDLPSCRLGMDERTVKLQTGKVLKRIFADRESPVVNVGGFKVTRRSEEGWSEERRQYQHTHHHCFEKSK